MRRTKGVRRDFEALEKRRFEAMRLLDQGYNQSETARRLKVARQTVSEWWRHYCERGAAGLRKAGAHGFPTPLWTCPRVARLIADEFGVRYHEGHVWKILRALNWSPQRPVGKARERNEEAIRNWRRKTWPSTKKKPKKKAARSFSSTKAD